MIQKSALLLFKNVSAEKYLMMVRAHGKPYLLLPGGKQEKGETVEQALHREIQEELSTSAQDIEFLDEVRGYTPDDRPLTISLFIGTLKSDPLPSSEIKEIVWLSRKNVSEFAPHLTPITTKEILPCLARYNLF